MCINIKIVCETKKGISGIEIKLYMDIINL